MELEGESIKGSLFVLLLLSCCFYLFLGIYSYQRNTKSKANKIFFNLCMCFVLWAFGYAMMLISKNINEAFFWRAVAVWGYCFFTGHWMYFAFLLNIEKEDENNSTMKILAHVPTMVLFIWNIMVKPSEAMIRTYYGWIDFGINLWAQNIYNLWAVVSIIAGLTILYVRGKNLKRNRVKRQNRIIFITCGISFVIGIFTDIILPYFGVILYPISILVGTIGVGGIVYAINKHRMMISTSKYISEYTYDTIDMPTFILDNDFTLQHCNKAFLKITNYKFWELEGKDFTDILEYESSNSDILIESGDIASIEVNLKKKNGNYITCELSSRTIYDEYEDMLGILIMMQDISERKKVLEIERQYTLKLKDINSKLKNIIREKIIAEKQLSHYVYYDVLTGLSNRKMMTETLEKLLKDKTENFAILFIDLDGFKHINDDFSHQVGDEILKSVAANLKNILGNHDTISRIGGDEFIIILENLKHKSYASDMAKKIQKNLKKPFVYNNEHLIVGASIGISIFPEHGETSDILIRKADVAMYEVKENGGYDYAIYSPKMEDKFIDKLELKKQFNKARENNEFVVYYQPIINLKSMEVVSCEGLIRWNKDNKIISPMEFIPKAKSVGEMVNIDNWVLENACMQCKEWNKSGANSVSISINTSYSQLKQFEFVSIVKGILEIHSLPPEYLSLEITEDEAMEDYEMIIEILNQLKSIGVTISLDDFGTGYSSLSYVNRLPIDKIKIDKSLITNLEKDYKNIMIVKSIVEMGHSLNIKIIVEGIETKEQLEILKELNCDYIQGYLIGKPMEAREFEQRFVKISL
jgi:diguanylate cyclase (GGDEF)-like protein/PAS domain S-box-containing protein